MSFLTPTIAYLHSIFEGSTPSSPSSQNNLSGKPRFNENDPFAAAFHAANHSKPVREDEQTTTDPFNLFCDFPTSPQTQDDALFELSPPDSGFNSSALDDHKGFFQGNPTAFDTQTRPVNPRVVATVASAPQPYLLPPTPPSIAYESPYANPSPDPANVPAQLKQRRRGPKPKNVARTEAEKEEVRAKFLERNKHAAKRCRERKKLGVEATMKLLREQEEVVLQLQMEKDLLEDEVARLRHALQNCGCEKSRKSSDSTIDGNEQDEEEHGNDKDMEDWLVSSPKAEQPEVEEEMS